MCEWLSKAQQQECHQGMGCCIFRQPDEVKGSDKFDHAQRSLAHQPNHKHHETIYDANTPSKTQG